MPCHTSNKLIDVDGADCYEYIQFHSNTPTRSKNFKMPFKIIVSYVR